MPRRQIEINLEEVARLAGLGLTEREICASLGISEDTLGRRKKYNAGFADAIERGKARAAGEVSNALFKAATRGNVAAIRWYEATRRGLSEKTVTEHSGKVEHEHNISLTDGELLSELAGILHAARARQAGNSGDGGEVPLDAPRQT